METLLSNCGSSINNNVLWSSYLSNDQLDLTESFFDKDFGISDLFPIELPGSIHYDIKKIESSESSNVSPSDISVTSDLEYDFPKVEIKNSDCMWSGLGNSNNNICNNNLYNNNRNNNNSYQQQQQQNNINSNEYQNYINTTTKLSMQNIPPGQSLLINSRLNLQNKKSQQQQQNTSSSACNNYYNKLSIPVLMTSDFLKDREQQLITNIRPDTPISLDDDAPEFKHSVDLAACIMGSNNISLDSSSSCSISTTTTINTDQMIINKLKEQLEDTTTKNIDLRQIIPFVGQNSKKRSLTEVLNVIGSDDNDEFNDDSCDDDNISDSDFDDDINGVLINNCNNSTSSSNSSSSSSSDNISSNCSIFSSSSPSRQNNYPMMHSDHSYTRSKDGIEDCAVDVYGSILETPSDSDEEIDVVSVGDKKLPTNPSDKDRRALQTKVAHKISARIVKTVNGIRTIPPRRRDSYESFNNNNNTQIGTITPNKIKSLGNSRYPTPAPTPYPISIYNVANNNVTTSSVISTIKNTTNSHGSSSRKRNSAAVAAAASDEYLPSNKRHRGKKYQQSKLSSNNHHTKKNNNNNNNNSGSVDCDVEEADTIEKRNLHNDMERQRRIGLKNLFEALKKQIPSIKDKERAPKVNILREAAKLCDQLNRDDKLISNQKQQLLNHLQRREALLVSLKAAQCKKEV